MYKKILVALDGSEFSLAGGEIALDLAGKTGSSILAAHIYDGKIHRHRLREMEPDLPEEYQEEEKLRHVRESHNELIYDGFKALSKGYIEGFEKRAGERDIPTERVHQEGRSYSGLLDLAGEHEIDLLVVGAWGLGFSSENSLGSTAVRILRLARCDVLMARRNFFGGGILAGVDGSRQALKALQRAITWSQALNKPLNLVAAYDPFFHGKVFSTMARALSSECQEDVGLNKQQYLHNNLIDEGLGRLYKRFLDQGKIYTAQAGLEAEATLLKGKAYEVLVALANRVDADLIVTGRYGHHRDDAVQIGSNSEAIVRLARTNVLVTEQQKELPADGISR